MKIRVYYEDTDASGIVYHANYFKFCERARSEEFFKNFLTLSEKDAFFVVRSIFNAEFIKPAFLGDLLEVSTKIYECKKASFSIKHEIKKDGEVIFKCNLLAVFVKNGKPVKIKEDIYNFLQQSFEN